MTEAIDVNEIWSEEDISDLAAASVAYWAGAIEIAATETQSLPSQARNQSTKVDLV